MLSSKQNYELETSSALSCVEKAIEDAQHIVDKKGLSSSQDNVLAIAAMIIEARKHVIAVMRSIRPADNSDIETL